MINFIISMSSSNFETELTVQTRIKNLVGFVVNSNPQLIPKKDSLMLGSPNFSRANVLGPERRITTPRNFKPFQRLSSGAMPKSLLRKPSTENYRASKLRPFEYRIETEQDSTTVAD